MPNTNDTRDRGDFFAYWERLSEIDKWLLLGRAVYMRYRRVRYIAAGALIIMAAALGVGVFRAPLVASVMLLVGFVIGLLLSWK